MYIQGLVAVDSAQEESSSHLALVGQALRAGVGGAIFLARARYVEEALAEAVRHHACQYVLIGAGFDTFAFRQPAGTRITVFELDHADTQVVKRRRLAEAGLVEPPHVHFVASDLEQEEVSAALGRVPFDPIARAFFAWPGVTMYLTRGAILATLRSIRQVTVIGSNLVFDYLDTDAFRPEKVSNRVRRMMEGAERVGEPMVSGFDPATIRSNLSSVGFRLLEDLSAPDLESRYFRHGTPGFHAPEHFHLVRAVAA